jgi:hypothetical protein
MNPTDVAYSFVNAINSGDPDRLSELMSEDHTFVDADGSEYSGREEMRLGWHQYFSMVPDFRIHVKEDFAKSNTIVLLGFAEGTFVQDGALKSENHWLVPAAWRVVVKDDRVLVWQLYVNPGPMAEISNRINAGEHAGANGSDHD